MIDVHQPKMLRFDHRANWEIMLAAHKPQIGIVPVYVDYFEQLDPELGRKKQAFAHEIEQRLRHATAGTMAITMTPMVRTVDAAARAAAELNERLVDVIAVIPLIAAFGELLITAAGEASVPVLALSVASEKSVPSTYTMAEMVKQSGGLGLQALCNTLQRRGRAFEICAGTLDDDAFPERVCRTLRAMAIPAILRRSRMGIIGGRFASMTDVELDLAAAHERLGFECVEISAAEWMSAYERVDQSAVADAVQQYRERFTIRAIEEQELERSARLAIALDRIVSEHRIDFGAVNSHGANCLQNDRIGIMATLGVSLLTTRGVPLAEVGDAPTAIAMAIGRLLAGSCIYAELDSVDFASSSWFIANSGELDLAAAAPGEEIILRGSENFRGLHGRGASFDAVVRPGEATLLSFTPAAGNVHYRLVAASGTVLPERRPCFRAVHALLALPRAAQAFEGWCRAGAVHHASLIPEHVMPALRTLSRIWPDVKLVEAGA
jgi:L-arabinose isomerase